MEIYLPVAQTSVNWAMILGMGAAVGFLAGMLGVGGGFVMTPLLIFYGIPPAIAVATQASPIAAASLVGALSQGTRQSVDFKLGLVLLCGGLVGSALGVLAFNILQRLGLLDFAVEFGYIVLLASIGALMLKESVQVILATRRGVQDIAIGTSQFQVFFVAAMTTLLHALSDHTVDIVLAFLLILGGVLGAQFGIRIGSRLRGEEARAALAILILGIAIRLLIEIVLTPSDVYSVVPEAS